MNYSNTFNITAAKDYLAQEFVNYFVQKGAKVMRDDLTGLYGGTVLGFDRKLQ